jgi:hypothetical protein
MANKDNPGNPPKQPLTQDPLVNDLSSEGGNLAATIQISGWLGRGSEEGIWNLYLTPKLDEYVQFSEQDLVHSQSIACRIFSARWNDGLAARRRACPARDGRCSSGRSRFSRRRHRLNVPRRNDFVSPCFPKSSGPGSFRNGRSELLGQSSHSGMPTVYGELLSHQGIPLHAGTDLLRHEQRILPHPRIHLLIAPPSQFPCRQIRGQRSHSTTDTIPESRPLSIGRPRRL